MFAVVVDPVDEVADTYRRLLADERVAATAMEALGVLDRLFSARGAVGVEMASPTWSTGGGQTSCAPLLRPMWRNSGDWWARCRVVHSRNSDGEYGKPVTEAIEVPADRA